MKTYTHSTSKVDRSWHQVDASGQILGRVATEIAQKLIGKNKPTYTPNIDDGDYVVVTNAEQIKVTGGKETKKVYYSHTGFPGGIKSQTFAQMQAKFPERVIEKAVYNMLPKNKLRKARMARLKVYAGSSHPHTSQLGK